MKLQRDIVHVIHRSEESDDQYVQGTPGERMAMVWGITCDVWAFGGRGDAQQRLQRDVTTLIRRERQISGGRSLCSQCTWLSASNYDIDIWIEPIPVLSIEDLINNEFFLCKHGDTSCEMGPEWCSIHSDRLSHFMMKETRKNDRLFAL